MTIQAGPIRMRIAPGTPAVDRAVACVAAGWPASQPGSADIPVAIETRLCITGTPGLLPPVRPFARDGDPASGDWGLSQAPLWTARGRGLDEARVRLLVPDVEAVTVHALQQFLRHFVTEALLALGGIALHAAAAGHGGRAHVFAAPAGGGKTTLARRFGGDGVLADDMALVVPGRGGPWVIPSPFPGREGLRSTGHAAPLGSVSELVKGVPASAERLAVADAVACLVMRAKVPDRALSVRRRVLDAALGLARSPGVVRLGLPPDRSPWPILEAT